MSRFHRRILGLVRLVACLAFTATSSLANPPRATRAEVIGNLTLPLPVGGKTEPEHRLYLYGRRLTGSIRATYLNGASYLNGFQWKPTPKIKLFAEARVDSPITLTPDAKKGLMDVPFIRDQCKRGRTLEEALSDFSGRQSATLQRGIDAYRANLSKGEVEALRLACATIDTSLAVADPSLPNGPRFDSNGSASVYFYGFGRMGVIATGSVKGTADTRPPMSSATAKQELESLRLYFQIPAAVVVIYDVGTFSVYTGQDGENALHELALIEQYARRSPGKELPRGLLKSLGDRQADEILTLLYQKAPK